MTSEPAPGGYIARALKVADQILNYIEQAVMAVVTIVLFVIMFLVSLDATLRYTMNSPLTFNFDLVSMYLLPIAMMLPVGFLLRRGGHISVDLFALMMPPRMRQFVLGLGLLAAGPAFWIMTYRIGRSSFESWEKGLVTTGMINWPIWLHQAIYSLAMGVLTARIVHIGITNLTAFALGRDDLEISILPNHDDPMEEAV